MVRALLREAANVLLTRVQRWSWLKCWGVEVARRRGNVPKSPGRVGWR